MQVTPPGFALISLKLFGFKHRIHGQFTEAGVFSDFFFLLMCVPQTKIPIIVGLFEMNKSELFACMQICYNNILNQPTR